MNLSKRNLSIFVGIAIVIIFFTLLLIILPQWQGNAYRAKFTPEDIQKLDQKDRIQLEKNAFDIENNSRTTLSQIVGGLALLIGLYLTYQNVKTAQESLNITKEEKITERFKKAVEMLGNDNLNASLDAVSTLELIAQESPKDRSKVMGILTAFLKKYSQNTHDKTENKQEQIVKPKEDIQAIIEIIGRSTNQTNMNLNFQGVNLTGYIFKGANLSGIRLEEAKLNDTDFSHADLSSTNLSNADLLYSDLSNANLSNANLSSANLSNANLNETNLSNSNLSRANLSEADLSRANLTGAVLSRANLSKVNGLTQEQLLSAHSFNMAELPHYIMRHLEGKELTGQALKDLKTMQSKETLVTGGDSSENRAGE